MALYNQEILRVGGERDYHRLRMCVKLHIEQAQRRKNFMDSEQSYRRGTVIKGNKGQKSFTGRKTGECFQWKRMGLVRKESLVVFYMNQQSRSRCILEKNGQNTGRSRLKPAAGNARMEERMKDKHPLLYQK